MVDDRMHAGACNSIALNAKESQLMNKQKVNGVEIAYQVTGSGSEAIAFLNGIGMTLSMWSGYCEFFSREFTCLTHDTRGQLMSEKPAMDYSMEMHADDLKALLDHLGIAEIHLVGTSYGSEIGQVFAYTYPGMAKTLCVITGVSEVDGLLTAVAESWAEAAVANPVVFFKAVTPWNYSPEYLAKNRDLIRSRQEAMQAMPADLFTAYVRLLQAFQKLDITKNLCRISCPTLVISAEKDILKPPSFGRIIHENIRDSEFVIIPGSGHAVVLEKPDVITGLVYGFIKTHL